MAWTPELEAELQQLESELAPRQPSPAAPKVPFSANPGAAQKYQETFNTETAKTAAGQAYQDQVRERIKGSLDAVAAGVEKMNKEGGYNPAYDNEELLFGVLPGVKPVIQFARSQGFAGDYGRALTNRETQQANVGALAAQLKAVIRQPGEGVWTDKDQEFLLRILPAGSGYDTDKNIIEGLRTGTLINSIEDYRKANVLNQGNEKAADQGRVAKPVDIIEPGVIDYREFFK